VEPRTGHGSMEAWMQ